MNETSRASPFRNNGKSKRFFVKSILYLYINRSVGRFLSVSCKRTKAYKRSRNNLSNLGSVNPSTDARLKGIQGRRIHSAVDRRRRANENLLWTSSTFIQNVWEYFDITWRFIKCIQAEAGVGVLECCSCVYVSVGVSN